MQSLDEMSGDCLEPTQPSVSSVFTSVCACVHVCTYEGASSCVLVHTHLHVEEQADLIVVSFLLPSNFLETRSY